MLQRLWQRHGKALGPGTQARDDSGIEWHSCRVRCTAAPHGVLPRKAHTLDPGARRTAAACVREKLGLSLERRASRKRIGVDHLHEHARAPALWSVGAPESGKTLRERFHRERPPIPLLAMIQTARRQNRSPFAQ